MPRANVGINDMRTDKSSPTGDDYSQTHFSFYNAYDLLFVNGRAKHPIDQVDPFTLSRNGVKQLNSGVVDWLSKEWRAESSLLKADR